MPILAYASHLSARPGDHVDIMVSSDRPYTAELVHLAASYSTAKPQGWDEPRVGDPIGTFPGRVQVAHPGSYLRIDHPPAMPSAWSVACWVWPTIPADGRDQGLIAHRDGTNGWCLGLDAAGHPTFTSGATRVTLPTALAPRQWVELRADVSANGITLHAHRAKRHWLPAADEQTSTTGPVSSPATGCPLIIGAGAWDGDHAIAVFNGKIADPVLAAADGNALASWNLAADPAGTNIPDSTGGSADAKVVNHPARVMTSHLWDGTWHDWRSHPEHYTAIYFHDDDVDDHRWQSDFTITMPDLPSAIYAVRLRQVNPDPADALSEEYVPIYVRPRRGTTRAKVAYLAPTNTYLAYANEQLFPRTDASKMTDQEVHMGPMDHYLLAHPELGASLYDLHRDGSGLCYSTRMRPVLTMRPKYRAWINSGARHFSADLHIVEWLTQQGIEFDVLTDEDLHVDGLDAIADYNVVLTGSHPEYWTDPAMQATAAFLGNGGRLMYLGGNGFYWVTGMAPGHPETIEVRRGYAGTRCWESAPGEVHLSTTGEQGGLWRFRGRGPNTLVGVGFTAQGWGGSEGYDRLPGSNSPEASFIFDGIAPEEVIGDFGLVMGGAAGDEIDRADPAYGTPPEAIVVATSQGRHSDYYQLTIEDAPMMLSGMGGRDNEKVRSDLVFLPGGNGGAVFSVGSINWTGSLLSNSGDNNVSRLTGNVLRRFMQRT